jgi:DNA-directed RNA polymerase beta' subunit
LGVAETLLRSAIEQVVEEKDNREAEHHERVCEDAYNDAMSDAIYGSE